jgi:hypothetical protein
MTRLLITACMVLSSAAAATNPHPVKPATKHAQAVHPGPHVTKGKTKVKTAPKNRRVGQALSHPKAGANKKITRVKH